MQRTEWLPVRYDILHSILLQTSLLSLSLSLSLCLSFCLSLCLSLCLSQFLCLSLFLCFSVCLSFSVSLSLPLSFCKYFIVFLSTSISVSQLIFKKSLQLSFLKIFAAYTNEILDCSQPPSPQPTMLFLSSTFSVRENLWFGFFCVCKFLLYETFFLDTTIRSVH